MYRELTDQEIITGCANGEHQALNELITKFYPVVMRICVSILGVRDVEDHAQEIFMNILQRSGKLAEVTSLFGWIYRITVNECRDVIRRQKIRRLISLSGYSQDRVDKLVIEDEMMSKHIEDQELWTMLQATLQQLEPRYRELVVLRDMEGLSYEEIAQITGTSLGLVKSRLFRAREILGKKMRVLSGEEEYVQ